MAEPLFLLAEVEIGASTLRRWLNAAPRSAASFDDWPDALCRGDSGIFNVAAPAERSVADALVAHCVNGFGARDGYLHCSYDEQARVLRFAACFQYGDEPGVIESAMVLCALLRAVAEIYTAKTPSFIRLFDAGGDLLRVEISKKASRIQSGRADASVLPAWFDEWISQENLGDPDHLIEGLFPPLARALKKQVALGALRASRQDPYRYDDCFWTDGEGVYGGTGGEPLQNADPKTFRRATPPNALGAAFYADARQIWYRTPMGDAVPLQSVEPGMSLQGWRPFGLDGEPLLRCGDTVWACANIDYPNGGSIPGNVDYPNGGNVQANVESVLPVIRSHGGVPTWEKRYSFEYVRPTRVEGASFGHVKGSLFEDGQSVYVQTSRGLIRLEGALPGMTTYVGGLTCNNGRVFRNGYEIQREVDIASLHCLNHDLYADHRRVYHLRDATDDGHRPRPDLHMLQDAEPANFRIVRALPNATLSGDETHVWLNGELIPELTPDAVRFIGSYFWTGGNHVYYCEKRIPSASPNTFEVLTDSYSDSYSDYAREGTKIYFRAGEVTGADAATFVADGTTWGHDRHCRYQFGEAVGARPSEFQA